jgi:chemotaxis family two-component system sensor kinase Cph1
LPVPTWDPSHFPKAKAFVAGDEVDAAGMTPSRTELKALAGRIEAEMLRTHQTVFDSSSAAALFPELALPLDLACGVLAFQIPTLPGALFMALRPQIVKTITWGGDPQKNLERKNFQGQINPRESFAAWKETIRSHAKEWTSYEIEGILFLRDFIFESLIHKQQLIRDLNEDLRQLRGKHASESRNP